MGGPMTITVNGKIMNTQEKLTFKQLAEKVQEKYSHRIVLAVSNGKIKELFKEPVDKAEVTFLTAQDKIGHDTYVRSAVMLLMKAAADVAGGPDKGMLKVEFSVGHGLYCSPRNGLVVDTEFVKKVKLRMQELAAAKIPYVKSAWPTDEAIALFKSQGMHDKVQLFRYRRGSYINVYCLDGYYDYNYGYMVPDTGYLTCFDVIPYERGLMMLLPSAQEPERLEPFEERQKLFSTLVSSTKWGEQIGIDTVGDLNDKICEGDLAELILVQEALQESRIGDIAEDIVSRPHVKFVMIAGPSSSGKTTFSHRLSIQLKARGLKPHPIAVDNYFIDRDRTPKDADGKYNFECLEAIDVKQFNEDMCALLEGKTVEMPTYNFKTGKREYNGNTLTLKEEDILVIEGIHGLNDQMSHALPVDSKYKIYISALTFLNVDEHNRIPTTDGRLLRRMVRDARTRGTSAKQTIAQWPSVRRGEEENIFPFQESADAMFNSVLIYELAVLKTYAEPLLYSIKKEDPEYFEAKRLLKFLDYFLGVSSENLPNNSIVREFVGGSCFRV
ncbi:MAG: nucleoside kinase [Lachnospiraceae bacterium]|nr:nucleoside kinase [Lachnospiraceae bacterium]